MLRVLIEQAVEAELAAVLAAHADGGDNDRLPEFAGTISRPEAEASSYAAQQTEAMVAQQAKSAAGIPGAVLEAPPKRGFSFSGDIWG